MQKIVPVAEFEFVGDRSQKRAEILVLIQRSHRIFLHEGVGDVDPGRTLGLALRCRDGWWSCWGRGRACGRGSACCRGTACGRGSACGSLVLRQGPLLGPLLGPVAKH